MNPIFDYYLPAAVVAAIKSKNFMDKIEAAADMLPASLAIEGINPVKLVYEKLSVSIHTLSDEVAITRP